MSRNSWTGLPRLGAGLLLGASLLLNAACALGAIYVNQNATGTPIDGSSWDKAYRDLDPAIQAATAGNEIWVTAGTYLPTNDYGLVATGELVQSRLKHFRLKNGVAIYGGFAGTETERAQRNPSSYRTNLSGDLNGNDDGSFTLNTENCYHVFYHPEGLALDATTVLDGVTIWNGNANGDEPHNRGGGMYNDGSAPTLTNCRFHYNYSTGGGSALFNKGSATTLSGGMVSYNRSSGIGGGIYFLATSAPTVSNMTFANNDSSFGGAVYCESCSPSITDCSFTGNNGYNEGGGIVAYRSAPSVTHCTFQWNVANYGAAIDNYSSTTTVTHCTFTANRVWQAGGAVQNHLGDVSPTFTGCVFEDNESDYNGGAVYNYKSPGPTMTDCTFTANTANRGGAMYNEESSPAVSDCTFRGNLASLGGGIVNLASSAATITDCLFEGNGCDAGLAGAMYNRDSSPVMRDCIFRGNFATEGGAVLNEYISTACSFVNCVFALNIAEGMGGAICNIGASPTLTNCSFGGNRCDADEGVAIYNHLSDDDLPVVSNPVFRNCIVWETTTSYPIVNQAPSTPTFRCCSVRGCLINEYGGWDPFLGTDLGGNVDMDPMYVSADTGDLRLLPSPACIDGADPDYAPDVDILGYGRVDDPQALPNGSPYPDMGAYEHQIITVISPSGGTLERGQKLVVRWAAPTVATSGKIQIELCHGDDTWVLSPGASNKGVFNWTVGSWKSKTQSVYPNDTGYFLRLSEVGGSASGESLPFDIGTVTSLEIRGPDSVNENATEFYSCRATFDTGGTADVTQLAKWKLVPATYAVIGKAVNGGVLITKPVPSDQTVNLTLTYGKGKPPLSASKSVTIVNVP